MPKIELSEEEIQVIYDALENMSDPDENPKEYNIIHEIQYKLDCVDDIDDNNK